MKRLPFGWIVAAILVSLAALPLLQFPKMPSLLITSTWIQLALVWGFILLQIIFPEALQKRGERLNQLRAAPAVTLLLSFMLLLIVLVLWGTFIVPEFSLFSAAIYLFLIAILWGWGSTPAARARTGKAFEKNLLANIMISLLTVFFLLGGIELWMRFYTIAPDGFAVTLQFSTWYERFFQPINSLGYRGYEPRAAEEGQQSILVIGDSFAVGHGINNIDDVFAYQLQDILGDDYMVNLFGHIGISPNVAEWVTPYPVKPDILIVSHFINDIEHTGIPGIETYQEFAPPPFVHWFTRRYFFFSYSYWHLYAGPRMVSSYADELLAAFENPEKWAAHQARLQEFVDWGAENDVPIIVLLWSTLTDLDASLPANQRVADFFTENGATVVDMRPILEPLRVDERMINPFDAHPNERVNRLAAEALAIAVESLPETP